MKFFFSGEVDTLVADLWRPVALTVEARLTAALGGRDYGPAVQEIAIIPMILRPEWREGHRERRLLKRKEAVADYRTWIDFQKFMDGDDKERERLLARNLVDAIADVSRKAGKDFSGDALIEDVLETLALTRSDVADGAAQLGIAADGAVPRR
jgi:hypothetical protein